MVRNQITAQTNEAPKKLSLLKSVLNFKKPLFWVIAAAIVTGVAAAIYFLLNLPLSEINVTESFFNGCFTEYNGVYIVLSENKPLNSHRFFYTELHNETNEEITFSDQHVFEGLRDGEWVSAGLGTQTLSGESHILKPNETKKLTITNQGFDFFKFNKYRLRYTFSTENGKTYSAWIELDVDGKGDLDELRNSHPHFFDLPTEDGLAVYMWKTSMYSYHTCYLATMDTSGVDRPLTFDSGVSIKEMRNILSTYDISNEKITVIPINHPDYHLSIDITDEYISSATSDFWDAVPESIHQVAILDVMVFDVDNDGEDEICRIEGGPLSGFFSLYFFVYETGVNSPSYGAMFVGDAYPSDKFKIPRGSYSFRECDDGVIRVQCVTNDTPAKVYLFDIGTSENYVKLSNYETYIAAEE